VHFLLQLSKNRHCSFSYFNLNTYFFNTALLKTGAHLWYTVCWIQTSVWERFQYQNMFHPGCHPGSLPLTHGSYILHKVACPNLNCCTGYILYTRRIKCILQIFTLSLLPDISWRITYKYNGYQSLNTMLYQLFSALVCLIEHT